MVIDLCGKKPLSNNETCRWKMVWRCMESSLIGDLCFIERIIDSKVYLIILEHTLESSAIKLCTSDDFIFYQENNPKHSAHPVPYLKVLNHLAQSPDLNVIKNLWSNLEVMMGKYNISKRRPLI